VPPKAPALTTGAPLTPKVSTKPSDKPFALMQRQVNKNMGLTPQGKLPTMPKVSPQAGKMKMGKMTTPKTGRK
jgi:hypothetical protein